MCWDRGEATIIAHKRFLSQESHSYAAWVILRGRENIRTAVSRTALTRAPINPILAFLFEGGKNEAMKNLPP